MSLIEKVERFPVFFVAFTFPFGDETSNKKKFIKPELAFQQIPLFLVFQFFHLQLLVVIQFTATATIYFDAIELTEEGTTTTTAAI